MCTVISSAVQLELRGFFLVQPAEMDFILENKDIKYVLVSLCPFLLVLGNEESYVIFFEWESKCIYGDFIGRSCSDQPRMIFTSGDHKKS